MTAFPLYVILLMLMILGQVQATLRFPVTASRQYAGLVNVLQVCHEALITYADHNPGVSGTIAASLVDLNLPPGATDPGTYTYLISSPGTVTTWAPATAYGQAIAIAQLQKLSLYATVAGPVVNGQIVPRLPTQPVAAEPGVPNGVIALQTVVRDH